jgi:hypothetical protein
MQKYAIILDGIVINSIEYELEPNHPIPGFDSACIAVQSEIAGPGYTYKNGLFTAPSPYPSWILENNIWIPPISIPESGGPYVWDEATKSWATI